MTSNVVSVQVNGTIQQAARLMLKNRVHRLVVLDDTSSVYGVVSTMDLLAAYADEPRP
jgi:CBS domain-containing protein